VDPVTGEAIGVTIQHVIALKAENARLEDVVRGLQRDVRGWAYRYAELERDRATEAREHPHWPAGKWLFDHWRRVCRHPRAVWTPDRFWLVESYLSQPKYGETLKARVALCRRAINGAAYDPWTVTRKNGTEKRFDEWERIFGGAGKLEEFVNRAPKP
jgi:hypothetical protein